MTDMTKPPSDTLQEIPHPRGLHYLRLKTVVVLLRSLLRVAGLFDKPQPPLPLSFQREDAQLPSRQQGRTIQAYVYRSTDAADAPLPVHIIWHGSGFVIPRLAGDYAYIDYHLKHLGPDCVLIDADYRKAPEHPFPAAVHDAIDIVNYCLSQPHLYDVNRITIGGFSAGAGLALVVGAHFGPQRIAGVVALYPVTDFIIKPDEYPLPTKHHDSGIIMPGCLTTFFLDAYFVKQEHKQHPLSSVKLADPASFPRLLVVGCKADTLYTEALEFVASLNNAGRTDVRFISIDNEGHGFDRRPKSPESVERRDKLYKEMIEFISVCSSSATSAA
ncbi:hypothetical protein EX895_005794 [Sporisorium graminicola]|uniref:Alpha/beta hydrolase fold-3 domain-containing protein n=1 Tax=Sporisorium graminicola TaxID=280036 RepID=A0A4U7KL25_9BASI|nr:hypothetical protein EX895_005794 [Sporisorium graminicola]TKY84714.1 hypothetical protein EX895_005794 [Sporisorium graminicola]